MIAPSQTPVKETYYTYKGNTFKSDAGTVKHLNYALALNRCPDRYVLATKEEILNATIYGNPQ